MTLTEIHKPAGFDRNDIDRQCYSLRTFDKVGGIVHWMAGYLPGTDQMFMDPDTGYATNYGIGSRNGQGDVYEVHRYTPTDRHRAFGSYNDDIDNRGISVELENDYPNSSGKPTIETHELAARLFAEKAVKHNWRIDGKIQLVVGDFPDHRFYLKDCPDFGVKYNLMTHRSMAIKDCPGTTDVEWIARRGNEIIAELLGTNGEDDMPTPNSYGYNPKDGTIEVPTGKWVRLDIDNPTSKDRHAYSLVSKFNGTVDILAELGLDGVTPGADIKLRTWLGLYDSAGTLVRETTGRERERKGTTGATVLDALFRLDVDTAEKLRIQIFIDQQFEKVYLKYHQGVYFKYPQ